MNVHTIGFDKSEKPLIFNGGEVLLSPKKDYRYLVAAIRNSVNFMELISEVRRAHWFDNKVLVPYLPYARADRLDADNNVCGALMVTSILDQSFAGVVNILECHSNVPLSYSVFRNIGMENLLPFLNISSEYTTIVIPDKGAVERAERVRQALKIPADMVIKCDKKRDVSTGKFIGFSVTEIGEHALTARQYLIVDDIIDNGGTFTLVQQALKDIVPKHSVINLFAAHTILKNRSDEDLEKFSGIEGIDKIYTTNSCRDFGPTKYIQAVDLTNVDVIEYLLKDRTSTA